MRFEHWAIFLSGLAIGLGLHALLGGGMRGTGFSGNIPG